MPRKKLGEFEKLVLLALLRLGSESYGALILNEIEERTGARSSSGVLYAALRRLEKRGLLTSRFGDPTPERGGRAKRYFRIEPEAVKLLRESQRQWTRMADGLEDVDLRQGRLQILELDRVQTLGIVLVGECAARRQGEAREEEGSTH